jgi:hypothetical protein
MLGFSGRLLVRIGCLAGAVVLLVLVGVCGVAGAVVPGAAWSVQSVAGPTNFIPGYEGGEEGSGQSYKVFVRNVGSGATDGSPVRITDTLPEAQGVIYAASTGVRFWDLKYSGRFDGEGGSDPEIVDHVVPPGDILELHVPVYVPASAPEGPVTNTVTVSGGGAPPVTLRVQNAVSRTPAPFAIKEFAFGVTGLDGVPDTQAGSHPYGVSTSLGFATERAQGYPSYDESYAPSQEAKNVVTDLPLGFVGSALAAPRCPVADLELSESSPPSEYGFDCPADTQIGNVTLQSIVANGPTSSVTANSFPLSPVYNLVPERGHPVEFGFELHRISKVHVFASVVHTAAGYVLRVTSPEGSTGLAGQLTRGSSLAGVTLSLFGDPEAEDGGNTKPNPYGEEYGVQSGGNLPVPSYTNPSDCSGVPLAATVHVDTWEHPGAVDADGEPDFSDPNWLEAKSELPATTGCELLQFSPSLTAALDTTAADSPTGLTTHLTIPQAPNEDFALATSDLRTATVALPPGLALSPSSADGLQACSDAQWAQESTQPATCPEASQVGTAVVHTPVLGEPLEGQVFLGTPNCGPCTPADAQDGRMVRLFMQLRAPNSGIVLKVPGTTAVDPVTGALVTSFPESPQQPLGDLTLTLKGGPRAPLATPEACGTYTTNSVLTPWSAPESGPPAESPSTFPINTGCVAGFAPAFTAGTTNNQAAAFSPLNVTVSRSDQEQDLGGVRVTTPPGLLGILKGVERCPEPQASQGTCGAGSLIGHATAGTGAGSHPFYTGGQVFLTGPYKGAPFGLSVVVPAVAGPFNLGTIVVRAAISIDPHTAQITVTSDPLPRMIDGIPLQIKTVNVSIDRSGFLFNPTDCEPLSLGGTLSSTQGASANVSSRFQAANCAALPFKPVFSVSTQAATSKHNGASLQVKGAFPAGEAGIHSVAVTLPVQLPARLTTIQQACTETVFNTNPASCPAGSNIGTATASTPILPIPIAGPVYLVSHGGAAFPDVVAILQGEGVTVDLTGSISIKHNITSSTFASVPDAPITSFQLILPEGPHSGLAAVVPVKAKGSLCDQSLAMPFTITGQNGAVVKENNKIAVTGCPRVKKKAKARKANAKHRRARG